MSQPTNTVETDTVDHSHHERMFGNFVRLIKFALVGVAVVVLFLTVFVLA